MMVTCAARRRPTTYHAVVVEPLRSSTGAGGAFGRIASMSLLTASKAIDAVTGCLAVRASTIDCRRFATGGSDAPSALDARRLASADSLAAFCRFLVKASRNLSSSFSRLVAILVGDRTVAAGGDGLLFGGEARAGPPLTTAAASGAGATALGGIDGAAGELLRLWLLLLLGSGEVANNRDTEMAVAAFFHLLLAPLLLFGLPADEAGAAQGDEGKSRLC